MVGNRVYTVRLALEFTALFVGSLAGKSRCFSRSNFRHSSSVSERVASDRISSGFVNEVRLARSAATLVREPTDGRSGITLERCVASSTSGQKLARK